MNAPAAISYADRHVLVVGAGGIGCPAAWALAEAGVGRLTLIDPDVVEISNLPRQVLYGDEDIGFPKAMQAARQLARADVAVLGLHARLDESNAEALLEGVDCMIDATDGAQTKDWLNQLAVRRAVPLIHAAALRSEARLLVVPAGGRPCLACLFGRLEEELGSCADLGVWNGAVGTIGFLAADAALRLLAEPPSAPAGYAVLDFEGARAMSLGTSVNAHCPVCANRAQDVEPYPDVASCRTPVEVVPAGSSLDLSTERCPMNLLRARKELAKLAAGAVLEIVLGEEGAATVPDGVRALGHEVLQEAVLGQGLRLHVRASGRTRASRLEDAALRRYARQIVLPEFGEDGQEKLARAHVVITGKGPAADSAARYLRAAGVGVVSPRTSADALPENALLAWAGGESLDEELVKLVPEALVLSRVGSDLRAQRGWVDAIEKGIGSDALQRACGTLLADYVQRQLVLEDAPTTSLSL